MKPFRVRISGESDSKYRRVHTISKMAWIQGSAAKTPLIGKLDGDPWWTVIPSDSDNDFKAGHDPVGPFYTLVEAVRYVMAVIRLEGTV